MHLNFLQVVMQFERMKQVFQTPEEKMACMQLVLR